MNKSLREEIYSYFEKEGTLVFPTENTARYWISEYAREKKKSLRADKVISFDKFREKFIKKYKDLKESDSWSRLMFINDFLSKNEKRLQYFFNTKYPESLERVESYLLSILTDIYSFEDMDKIKIYKLKNDIALIQEKYTEFLSINGYYEKTRERASLDNLTEELTVPYYVIASDINPSFNELKKDLNNPEWLKEIHLKRENKDIVLNRYQNEKLELRDIFSRIAKLSREGTNGEDIIISTPDLQRLKPYIEREAYKYNIPLSYVNGDSLTETIPGIFLKQIQDVYNNGFSYSSLSSLLNNMTLPFQNDKGKKLLDEMVGKNIFLGTEDTSKINSEEVLRLIYSREYYKTLYRNIVAINTAEGFEKLRKSIQSLSKFLFGEDGFENNEDHKNVFSTIIKHLADAEDRENELNIRLNKPFQSFLKVIESEIYTPQSKKVGISVYKYDQDALLAHPYHFVFALNDRGTKKEEGRRRFLEEMEVDEENAIDLSNAIFNLYQNLSENVYLSTSLITYSGATLSPSYFIENDLVTEAVSLSEKNINEINDSFQAEMKLLRGELTKIKPVRSQKTSFDTASKTARKMMEKIDDFRNEGVVHPLFSPPISLSPNSIKTYKGCPFKYLIDKKYRVEEASDVPVLTDNKIIGNVLHTTLEVFFRVNRALSQIKRDHYKKELVWLFYSYIDTLEYQKKLSVENETGDRRELLNSEIMKIFYKNLAIVFEEGDTKEVEVKLNIYLEELERNNNNWPSILSLLSLKSEYTEKLKNLIDNYMDKFPNAMLYSVEKREREDDLETEGYRLHGITDHVLIDENGNYVIVDFKKGKASKYKVEKNDREEYEGNKQLVYYKFMFEKDDVKVSNLYFYAIESEAFVETVINDELLKQTREELENVYEGIIKGSWSTNENGGECKNCGFKSICRRKYTIK